MKFKINIAEAEYKEVYDYVKYCLVEDYENTNVLTYNYAFYALISNIGKSVSRQCDETISVSVVDPNGNEIAVSFTAKSEDGLNFEIEYLGNVITTEEMHREMGEDKLQSMSMWATMYAEIHHGLRTKENRDQFDKERNKFLIGVSKIIGL